MSSVIINFARAAAFGSCAITVYLTALTAELCLAILEQLNIRRPHSLGLAFLSALCVTLAIYLYIARSIWRVVVVVVDDIAVFYPPIQITINLQLSPDSLVRSLAVSTYICAFSIFALMTWCASVVIGLLYWAWLNCTALLLWFTLCGLATLWFS